MPPLPSFSVRLQHGIAGGFAPPIPNAIHVIDFTSTDQQQQHLHVTSSVRQKGTSELSNAFPKTVAVASDSDDEKAIHELQALLKELPVEHPPGSKDIYGLDTSIAWNSDDLMWCNGGPEGCGGGHSFVEADEEHKAKFKRAVEIVNGLVNKAK
ncbi:hypothetical protein F5887DRAFT_1268636 [Amanita rubescens]|nr:hypothetical protein F5887DRAFT_1268636 [Amanita rubescens]